MITRRTRIQVMAFVLLSLTGVAFVGLRYVGLADTLLGGKFPVYAEFATAGGAFRNAAVTFRGVPVGKVGDVTLARRGNTDIVKVTLLLDRGTKVPKDLRAVVTNRSAVGEQYVDLRPETDSGPFLGEGDVIGIERTGTPLPVETLLLNLNRLVQSVDLGDLTVVIDELGKAFEGSETALQRILDANDALLTDATTYLPETIKLIRDGRTVLESQRLTSDAIQRWAAGLAKLTTTLRTSDPDLRRLMTTAPPAAAEVIGLTRDLDPTIGQLLGNLITVNGIAVRRLAGVEATLVAYPLVLAGGFTVTPGDGTAHFGLVLNVDDPPPCKYDRNKRPYRCSGAERGEGSAVRGWQNAPRPGGKEIAPAPLPPSSGDPAAPGGTTRQPAGPPAGPTIANYDPVTGLVVGADGLPIELGGTGGQERLAGAQSWKQLLLAGVAG